MGVPNGVAEMFPKLSWGTPCPNPQASPAKHEHTKPSQLWDGFVLSPTPGHPQHYPTPISQRVPPRVTQGTSIPPPHTHCSTHHSLQPLSRRRIGSKTLLEVGPPHPRHSEVLGGPSSTLAKRCSRAVSSGWTQRVNSELQPLIFSLITPNTSPARLSLSLALRK